MTREARGTDFGVVAVTRLKSDLSNWGARYYKRKDWGGSGQSGGSQSTFVTGPLVLKNPDGRLEVFIRGSNKALYHKWQTNVNGSWSSGWHSLGGTIKAGFTGLVDYQGLIHIFAVDDVTTKAFHIRQLSTGGWTTWVELKPTSGSSANVSDGLACLSKNDGCIMVFGVNADSREVNRIMTTSPGGLWSTWNVVGARRSFTTISRAGDVPGKGGPSRQRAETAHGGVGRREKHHDRSGWPSCRCRSLRLYPKSEIPQWSVGFRRFQ